MHDDTIEPFWFPAVGRKKLTAAFDGGRLTSDGGVMLLAAAERRVGIAQRLASLIADPRNPLLITHSVEDILRARMLAIACGYEDSRICGLSEPWGPSAWRACSSEACACCT